MNSTPDHSDRGDGPPEHRWRPDRVFGFEPIRSPSNPLVRQVRQLAQRKHREEQGAFLLEGERLVGDALANGVQPRTLLVREDFQPHSPEMAAVLETHAPRVRIIERAVFDGALDVITPQGIAAVVPLPDPRAAIGPFRYGLLLDGVSDPGNVGTLLRSAAAAGTEVVMAAPGTADLWSPKVVRAAMGAHFRLRLVREDEKIDHQAASVAVRVIADANAGRDYTDADLSGSLLIIVGSEAHGASTNAVELANTVVRIPMAAGVESLNAAVAGSIILFEAARQRRERRERCPAEAPEMR